MKNLLSGFLTFILKSKAKRQLNKLGRNSDFQAKVHAMNHAAKELQDWKQKLAEEEGIEIDPHLK